MTTAQQCEIVSNAMNAAALRLYCEYTPEGTAQLPVSAFVKPAKLWECKSSDGNGKHWFDCNIAGVLKKRIAGVLRRASSETGGGSVPSEDELCRGLWSMVESDCWFVEAVDIAAEDDSKGREAGVLSVSLPFVFSAPERPSTVVHRLDHNRLTESHYVNWIRVGLALREVSAVLAHVVDEEAIIFHTALLEKMEKRGIRGEDRLSLYTAAATPDPTATRAADALRPWVAEIASHHNQKDPEKRILQFSNSDARKWCSVGGHWEVMKLFCAGMGKHHAAITDHASAQATDSASLLTMMQWCDIFRAHCSSASLKAAKDARNPWAHNQAMEFDDAATEQHLRALAKLLQEDGFKDVPMARKAVEVIQEIKMRDFGAAVLQQSEKDALNTLLILEKTVAEAVDRLTQEMELIKIEGKESESRLSAQVAQQALTLAKTEYRVAAAAAAVRLEHMQNMKASIHVESHEVAELLQNQDVTSESTQAELLSGWADQEVHELDRELSAVSAQFSQFREGKHCLKLGHYEEAERCFQAIQIQLEDKDANLLCVPKVKHFP
jgi:hypothetical protein